MGRYYKYIFWAVGLICLGVILYLRLIEGLTREYGKPDEFSQLHFVYLLSHGFIPFTDFFNIYPPLFPVLLVPVFKIAGDSFLVLTLSRVVIFIFFLLMLVAFFGIMKLLAGKESALAAVVLAGSLPMSIEKSIEIRPDNLMLPLFLLGIFFYMKALGGGKVSYYFLSGASMMLSFLVLPKIAFSIFGFVLGAIALSIFNKHYLKKININAPYFIAGSLTVFFFYSLILLKYGIFTQTFISSVKDAHLIVSNIRFMGGTTPLYWLTPTAFVYGSYKGLSWYLNFVIIGLALIGFIRVLWKFFKTHKITQDIILLIPTITSFIFLYTVQVAFLQYLLPLLAFFPFFIILGLKLMPKSRLITLVLMVMMTLAMWQSWQNKKIKTDKQDREFINYVLTNTSSEDKFWGENAGYIFRKDGYPVYYDFQSLLKVYKRYPPIIASLEKNNTKYLLLNSSALMNYTWPYDQYELRDFVDWVKNNYTQTGKYDLWVKKGEE